MTPTSDERREVAARLREYSNDVLKDGSLLKTLKDVTGACSWRDVLDCLANLIDPTCVPEAHNYGSIVGNACPRCGWSVAGYMRYCPGCGARVVSGDGTRD